MPLDRLDGHEQGLGDLSVGQPVDGQLGHPPLARRQRVEPGERGAARARAGCGELGPGPLAGRHRPAAMREVQGAPQDILRLRALARPPQGGAQVRQRASLLQRLGGAPERFRGLPKQAQAFLAAHNQTGAAPRRRQRSGGAERAC